MKRHLLFAMLCIVGALNLSAQTASPVGEGTFYLYNVGTGKAIIGAKNYGTKASIAEHGGIPVTLASSDGGYTLSTSPLYNNKFIGVDGYVDQGSCVWTFTSVEGQTNVYKLNRPNGDYLYAENTFGDDGAAATALGADPGNEYGYWKLVTADNLKASFENATESNPIDATPLIVNPQFSRVIGNGYGWSMEAGNKNLCGGKDVNKIAESWRSAFTLSQTISVPNGKYRLRAQACVHEYTKTGADFPVVYIDNTTTPFKEHTGDESSMDQFSDLYLQGSYFTDWTDVVTVTNGQITIGVRGTRTDTWCTWDNFQLEACGPIQDLTPYIEAWQNALNAARATATSTAKKAEWVQTELESVIDDNDEDAVDQTSQEALEAATAALVAANTLGQKSIHSYQVIAQGFVPDNSIEGWVCENPQGIHVNTWSVEGNPGNDPSGMVTPFIENWVGRGSYLGEGKVYYKLEGLEPGEVYYAQALVRSYNEANADAPNGPDFFINDVVTNMATEGTTFKYNNMSGIYATLGGGATVGDDGILTIGIEIASNRNYNWVAFKNVSISTFDAALAVAIDKANALIDLVPPSIYNSVQNVVVSKTNPYPDSVEGFEDAIASIEQAVIDVEPYKAPYATWKNVKEEASNMFSTNDDILSIINSQNSLVEAADDVSTINEAISTIANLINKFNAYLELKEYADALVGVNSDNEDAKPALRSAISTAETNIQTVANTDDMDAVNADLKSAMITYVAAANPVGENAKFNLTFMLTNPDLTNLPSWAPCDGWYTEQTDGNSQVMNNDNATSEDGTKTKFYEYWSNNAKNNGKFNLYQQVTLPEGTYNMSCYAFARQQDGETGKEPKVGVFFYANDTQGSSVSNQRLEYKEVEFVNTEEQNVKIGLKAIDPNTYNWMGIGYIELYKVPAKTFEISENSAWDATTAGAGNVTLTRAISDTNINTLVLPFSMTAEEVNTYFGNETDAEGEGPVVYVVGSYANDNIKLTKKIDGISANQPVLLKATKAGTSYEIPARTIVATEDPSTTTGDVKFVGVYEFTEGYTHTDGKGRFVVPEGSYIVSSNQFRHVENEGTAVLKSTRAYFTVTDNSGSGIKALTLSFDDDEATGIATVEDGQLNILTGKVYDLSGREVKNPTKGLYIIDGRKVMIK